MLNGYPKGLSVKLLFYKGMCNQASNVRYQNPDPRPSGLQQLSQFIPVTNSGDFDLLTVQYRQYSIKYKAVL